MRSRFGAKADGQLVPDTLVRPVLHLLGQRHVDVIAAARFRPHRSQHKAALVVRIDQLVITLRHIGQDAQPAERIDPLELLADAGRNRLAAGAVEPVTARNKAAVDTIFQPALLIGDIGAVAIHVAQRDILRLVNNFQPAPHAGVH